MDVLQSVNDILSPYRTFESVVSVYIGTRDPAIEGVSLDASRILRLLRRQTWPLPCPLRVASTVFGVLVRCRYHLQHASLPNP